VAEQVVDALEVVEVDEHELSGVPWVWACATSVSRNSRNLRRL
jgi:hypothetical protein